jgi:hypothetical protein
MVQLAPLSSTVELRSRRALLGGALGGIAALAATVIGGASRTGAAAGSSLIIGSTSNNAGTSNTSLTTSSTGTALLVTQNGTGTALRGSAVGTNSIAGFFTANNGTGISGVTGRSSSYGVFGQNNGAAGTGGAIRADGNQNHGLVATSDNADRNGVKGLAPGTGVYGEATSGSGETAGVFGVAYSSDGPSEGVLGIGTADSYGVRGVSDLFGVVGESSSSSGWGMYATSDNIGIMANSASEEAVYGNSSSGFAVYGTTTTGIAGWFDGPVHVSGFLTKSGGGFKIDHPVEPATRYLIHSFVESPDMKNVYDGVVTLDAKGEATVELPSYFEALNRDVRYQLTAVGSAAPELHVKTKVASGAFRIAGGAAGQEVCWQVTGIRQDAFAEANPIVVEEPKPASERGLYLHPDLLGQPEEKGLEWRHRVKVRALRPADAG